MLLQSGELDRARLGALVFADASARDKLNAILHPLIRQRIADQVNLARSQDMAVAVIDAALLLELGAKTQCDAVLTIECPAALQLHRLMTRNQLDESSASQRIAAQISAEQREASAQWRIDNDGSLAELGAALKDFGGLLHCISIGLRMSHAAAARKTVLVTGFPVDVAKRQAKALAAAW